MTIPQKIQELANKVRTAIYGADVRESIAKAMEISGETSNDTEVRQTILEQQFDDVVKNATEVDPSSVELVAAQTNTETGENFPSIGKRLDEENKRVSDKIGDSLNFNGFKNNVKKGTITLQFDDMYKSWYNNCYLTILKPNNIPFTVPFSPNEIANTNRPEFCNQTELDDVFSNPKAEFVWHALDHNTTFNNTVADSVLQYHIDECIKYYQSKGIRCYGWVAPNTRFDPKKLSIMERYFNFGWCEDYAIATPTYDTYYKVVDKNKSHHRLNRISLDYHRSMSDSKISTALNEVLNGAWLTVYAHRIDETINDHAYASSTFMQELIDWANANGVEILNSTEAFIKHNGKPVSLKYDMVDKSKAYLKDVPVLNMTATNTDLLVAYQGGSSRTIQNITFSGGVATIQNSGVYNVRIKFYVSNPSTVNAIDKMIFLLKVFKNNTAFDNTNKIIKSLGTNNEYEEIVYNRNLELVVGDAIKFNFNTSNTNIAVYSTDAVMEIRKIG